MLIYSTPMECCIKKKSLTIGNFFPNFSLEAVIQKDNKDEIISINNEFIKGKNILFFFYPLDFTFVCPTELIELAKLENEFIKENTMIISVSTDSVYSHKAWKKDNEKIRKINFPMASDLNHSLSQNLGILNNQGICNRASYLVNSEGIIEWMEIFPSKIGRDPKSILRVVQALKTEELCPACWNYGDECIIKQ